MALPADVRFTTSTIHNPGGTWPSIWALDANTYFVSFASTVGLNQVIHFMWTTNGGTSWNGPVVVDSIPTMGGNVIWQQTEIRARDANNIIISYHLNDTSNDMNNVAKIARTSNGGMNAIDWTVQTIDATGQISSSSLFDSGTEAFLVTSNYVDGNMHLYTSNDWITWTGPSVIDTPTVALSSPFSAWVSVWGAGNKLMVGFEWFRGSGVICSTDCGVTWPDNTLSPHFVLDAGACPTVKVRSLDGNTIYFAFDENTSTPNSNSCNGFVKSIDGGQNWGAITRLDDGSTAEASAIGLFLANANEWLLTAGQSFFTPKQLALYQFSAGDVLASETSLDAGDLFGNHVYDFSDIVGVDPSTILCVSWHNATSAPGVNTLLLHKSNVAITGAFDPQVPFSCAAPNPMVITEIPTEFSRIKTWSIKQGDQTNVTAVIPHLMPYAPIDIKLTPIDPSFWLQKPVVTSVDNTNVTITLAAGSGGSNVPSILVIVRAPHQTID